MKLSVKVTRKSNFKVCSIDITFRCGLRCKYCNRYCGIAPSDDEMTLEQIDKFVQESIDLDWKWDKISIVGGEPLLHSNLDGVIEQLNRYHEWNPKCAFTLTTNGVTNSYATIPQWIIVQYSESLSFSRELFYNCLQAPKDRGFKDTTDCEMHVMCGLQLSRYGFACCAAGGPVYRLFQWDGYIKSLKDVTQENLNKQLKELCSLCGRNMNHEVLCKNHPEISESYKEALKNYTNKQLELY